MPDKRRPCKMCGKPCNGTYCRSCFCSNARGTIGNRRRIKKDGV